MAKEKLMLTKQLKEKVTKVVKSGMSQDEFILFGPNYLKIWHFSPGGEG